MGDQCIGGELLNDSSVDLLVDRLLNPSAYVGEFLCKVLLILNHKHMFLKANAVLNILKSNWSRLPGWLLSSFFLCWEVVKNCNCLSPGVKFSCVLLENEFVEHLGSWLRDRDQGSFLSSWVDIYGPDSQLLCLYS